jgi:hypothetical protein
MADAGVRARTSQEMLLHQIRPDDNYSIQLCPSRESPTLPHQHFPSLPFSLVFSPRSSSLHRLLPLWRAGFLSSAHVFSIIFAPSLSLQPWSSSFSLLPWLFRNHVHSSSRLPPPAREPGQEEKAPVRPLDDSLGRGRQVRASIHARPTHPGPKELRLGLQAGLDRRHHPGVSD